MLIPINFKARDYQIEALEALEKGVDLSIWCWARRAGKDKTAFAYGVKKMINEPMNVALVFPTKEQGMKSFWNNIENDGFKTIDGIPKQLIARQDNNNMRIILKNGSVFEVLGATDPQALRGANAKLYIFSEFVDIDSEAYDVVKPIVAVNKGQIIIQSTPKIDGISGGTFKILFDRAIKHPNQFASRVVASEYLTDEVLEELRQDCIARNGNDFYWRQEYLCDWGQVSHTSYYGGVLQVLSDRGRIGEFPHKPSHPVYTAWDLGTSDSTAITFFQMIDGKPRIIDYYETHDIGYEPIIKSLKNKPYNIVWNFIPHDGSLREQSDTIRRIDKLKKYGLTNASLIKRESVEDGIRNAIEGLANTHINEATTVELRRKLMIYKRKFNKLTGDYEGPEHNTASHAADSVRYMFASLRQAFDQKTGAFLYDLSNIQSEYEAEEYSTPALYNWAY